MKRLTAFLLACALTLSLSSCGDSGQDTPNNPSSQTEEAVSSQLPEESETPSSEPEESGAPSSEASEEPEANQAEESNILVAYFSRADNAVLAEDVDAVASPSVIAPGNVQQLAGWVQEETGADLFSIRVTEPYPSDWDDCLDRANQERGDNARPELVENLEDISQYDTIFCSHGTGGLANSVEIITEAIPDAVISDDIFDCYEEDAPSSQEGIQSWVEGLGF